MTYEKHTTHTDALDTLGSIITSSEGRDAIHLAVEPVEAAFRLSAGDHVKFTHDGKATHALRGDAYAVGIVDPFLTEDVRVGEWFWLVVYPREITSLRHVWEHPAFPASGEVGSTGGGLAQVTTSRAWLVDWLSTTEIDHVDVDQFLEAAESGYVALSADDPGYMKLTVDEWAITSGGTDAYGRIPPEVWDHVKNVLGKEPVARPDTFSCSC